MVSHKKIARFATASALALAVGISVVPSHAAPEPAKAVVVSTGNEAAFNTAYETFLRARNGDNSQIEPAIAAFEKLLREAPQQPLYAAYLGSALALKGRAAWMPWNKLKYPEQGLDRLDQALAALKPEHDRSLARGVPVSLETRLVAASTFITLPDNIFHRRKAGKSLLAEIQRHPAFAASPAQLRSGVYLLAADVAKLEDRKQDEVAQLKQVLAIASSGSDAVRAQARLKELGQ